MSFIIKIPGVCGGDACVRGTRIPVWIIVKRFREGTAVNRLRTGWCRPPLKTREVEDALRYALDNFAEIEADIAANDAYMVET